mmetsp:Transcript_9067/g.55304  ORF Transcript_9067/g.55304 Transcript_9067/m.55304 type:complete len:98 (-) Transcript_9067:82-375(-)
MCSRIYQSHPMQTIDRHRPAKEAADVPHHIQRQRSPSSLAGQPGTAAARCAHNVGTVSFHFHRGSRRSFEFDKLFRKIAHVGCDCLELRSLFGDTKN